MKKTCWSELDLEGGGGGGFMKICLDFDSKSTQIDENEPNRKVQRL